MSRKGKLPITIPNGVDVNVNDNIVTVKGPKGTMTQEIQQNINVEVNDGQAFVTCGADDKKLSKFQGLYRTLVDNMVVGVSKGFEKKLQMIGVGYRAAVQGRSVSLQVGLSHPCALDMPEGVDVAIEKGTLLTITGYDKQKIGQFAADIRRVRPPEPYQGKGIRYVDEYVRRKAGKKAGK